MQFVVRPAIIPIQQRLRLFYRSRIAPLRHDKANAQAPPIKYAKPAWLPMRMLWTVSPKPDSPLKQVMSEVALRLQFTIRTDLTLYLTRRGTSLVSNRLEKDESQPVNENLNSVTNENLNSITADSRRGTLQCQSKCLGRWRGENIPKIIHFSLACIITRLADFLRW